MKGTNHWISVERKVLIHISEIMHIVHIKNVKLPIDKQKFKGRLVFRGDACRDERGVKTMHMEMKSLPASFRSSNIIALFHAWVAFLAATKAYL